MLPKSGVIHMKKVLAFIVLLVLLVPAYVGAVEIESGDQVTIDTQVDDDLFVTGGTITINASVNGDVFAVGGMIQVNAPIKGDLIVAGGQVVVNADVQGKIIAGCGTIEVKGRTEKVVIGSGTITIQSSAVIDKYALVAAGEVYNQGTINGDFIVAADTFKNTGTVTGEITYEEPPSYAEELKSVATIFAILWKLGFLILGLFFIKMFGRLFFTIEKEVRESAIKKGIVGLVLIIATALIIVVLAITVIGLPIAAVLALFYVMVLMVAGLFVSYTFGDWILGLAKIKTSDMAAFTLGFIILNVLFIIPYAGGLIRVVTVSLGFGALFYAIKNNWKTITAPKP